MLATLDHLRAALPPEGLFAGKNFLLSPEPLRLGPALIEELETLGHRLQLFQRAANELYLRAHRGKAPAWVAEYLDGGKPAELLEFARHRQFYAELPGVIRPDLLLTPGAAGQRGSAFAITELDSVPGGIGLTAWLSHTYAALGHDVLGGAYGMIRGFHSLLGDRADILVSDEAGTYRPEMEWAARIARSGEWREEMDGAPADWRVLRAEDYTPSMDEAGEEARSVYRFFEQFDLPNLPHIRELMDAATAGRVRVTPPFKPWLEEKLWLALFWSRPLQKFWRRELSDRHFRILQKSIPFSWVMDPTPLPHHAVIPGLEINDWKELAGFSQKQRELVLKVSGFSPEAWGSRGVVVGSDVPQHEWAAAVGAALKEFAVKPRVLMRFAQTKIIEHPYYDPATSEVRTMRGRVRLCPYYFVKTGRATLGGALATIVPADKKIVHGMTDAILVPAAAG
jgi:hypothetical protein